MTPMHRSILEEHGEQQCYGEMLFIHEGSFGDASTKLNRSESWAERRVREAIEVAEDTATAAILHDAKSAPSEATPMPPPPPSVHD